MTIDEYTAGPFVHLNDFTTVRNENDDLKAEIQYLQRKLKHVRRHNANLQRSIANNDRLIIKQRDENLELKAELLERDRAGLDLLFST